VVALFGYIRKKVENESFQKLQKTLARLKEVVLLHPLRETDTVSQTRRKKQEEHVPRHIELTAVLREILRQRIESNRIERFE
jgi:predicted solute-binding protein